MEKGNRVRVSLIIVNFNGVEYLRHCLDSIEAQLKLPDEVIVVDNGSSDHSCELVRRQFPWIQVIETGENLGFSAGNNVGIRSSTGDIIILLNNDTVASPGFVEAITLPFAENPDLSSVSGVMVFHHAPDTVATTGIEVYDNGLAFDRSPGSSWRSLDQVHPVFGPTGGAMAIRRSALEDVDLFPEPFFLYLEDVDLAWRLRLRGHRSVAEPSAWALHHYSASSGEGSDFKEYFLARNRFWVLIRCWPAALWRRNWHRVIIYEIGALAYGLLNRRWGSVRGRITGWLSARRLLKVRSIIQRRSTSQEPDLLYWMSPAPSVHSYLNLRRRMASLTDRRAFR
jgi:GT2 family glycosyltransferase